MRSGESLYTWDFLTLWMILSQDTSPTARKVSAATLRNASRLQSLQSKLIADVQLNTAWQNRHDDGQSEMKSCMRSCS